MSYIFIDIKHLTLWTKQKGIKNRRDECKPSFERPSFGKLWKHKAEPIIDCIEYSSNGVIEFYVSITIQCSTENSQNIFEDLFGFRREGISQFFFHNGNENFPKFLSRKCGVNLRILSIRDDKNITFTTLGSTLNLSEVRYGQFLGFSPKWSI